MSEVSGCQHNSRIHIQTGNKKKFDNNRQNESWLAFPYRNIKLKPLRREDLSSS